jgi:hypothetical protein
VNIAAGEVVMDEALSKLAQEWEETTNSRRLITLLEEYVKPSARKRRLAACACCRQMWGHMDGPARLVVEYAERYADHLIPLEELILARDACPRHSHYYKETAAARAVGYRNERAALDRVLSELPSSDRYARAIRDLFGNPFRPISLEAYRTHEVKALAASLYETQALERMDILADALEDAGCTEAVVIDHCRRGGEHLRGCWVLDALLGQG